MIRVATLDDVRGIVEVYCSSIDRWTRRVDGKELEARYEDLSLAERWAHGGPWMSIETCAIHLNYLLISDQYPLVAVIDSKVMGELELYIGYENSMLGFHGFIDVLEVHRDYRGRGIGRKLVEEAIEISRKRGCEYIAVWPNPEAIGFYRKCGFDIVAFRVKSLRLDLSSARGLDPKALEVKSFPEDFEYLKSWIFVSPRIETSFVAWLKSRWDYAIERNAIKYFEASLPDIYAALILESLWLSDDEANLYLWIRDLETISQAIDVATGIAKHMGFRYLRLLVSDDIYNKYIRSGYRHEVLDEYLVLSKYLK